MSDPRQRPCPIAGCTDRRLVTQIMCRRHWYQVPLQLRNQIWQLYSATPGSSGHLKAIHAAIRHVNQGAHVGEQSAGDASP